jgi:hypothetical protein
MVSNAFLTHSSVHKWNADEIRKENQNLTFCLDLFTGRTLNCRIFLPLTCLHFSCAYLLCWNTFTGFKKTFLNRIFNNGNFWVCSSGVVLTEMLSKSYGLPSSKVFTGGDSLFYELQCCPLLDNWKGSSLTAASSMQVSWLPVVIGFNAWFWMFTNDDFLLCIFFANHLM